MADEPQKAATPKATEPDAEEALEKQVAQLKREISKINRALAARVEEAVDEAGDWYDSATDRASRSAKAVRAQTQTATGVFQDNPGTVSAAFMLGGLIGLLLGLALGASDQRRDRF